MVSTAKRFLELEKEFVPGKPLKFDIKKYFVCKKNIKCCFCAKIMETAVKFKRKLLCAETSFSISLFLQKNVFIGVQIEPVH